MSKASPLPTSLRESHYLTQTGRTELTPAQRRRSQHKQNDMLRPTARIGRLRRRYDQSDSLKVRQTAAQRVALLRQQVAWSRFGKKFTDEQKTARRAFQILNRRRDLRSDRRGDR